MTNLRDTLEELQAYVLENNNTIQDEVTSPPQGDAAGRLRVYRNAYYIRLREILEADFATLLQLVAAEKFKKIAHDYIDSYPSSHFSVRYFGRNFSEFLSTYAGAEPIYQALARFEWALGIALDAADADVISMDDLQKIPPESWGEMQLIAHPSVATYTFQYNVIEIWQALDAERPVPDVIHSDERQQVLVWRKQNESYFAQLTQNESWALNALIEGQNFAEVCEGLCEWVDESEVAQFAAAALSRWIQEDVFSEICLS